MERLRLAGLCLLLAAPGRCGSVSASGYVKELWQYSRSTLNDRPYFLNTGRARLTLDAAASVVRAHADYDHEVLAGSFLRTPEYSLFGFGEPRAWLAMDRTIRRNSTALWRHRLYRGWAGVETEESLLRFGRQRVAWGTGKLWNPTDVLNPYHPTSVERDERRGVDALYGRRALGNLSQAELAWAPRDAWPGHSLLGRVKTNLRGADVSLMGGKTASSTSSWMAGGDFAGTLWEGTFHGEWSYTDLKTRTPFWKLDIGYDYTFPEETRLGWLKNASAVVEYLHSGSGALDRARYNFASLFSGREVTLARDYVGFTFSKDAHPLVKLELAAIANLNDGSRFFSPSLQWNALNDLYLTAGLQRFSGGKDSEFGRAPNVSFLQAQFYF